MECSHCRYSDAWRCAADRGISAITCGCSCHRTDQGTRVANITEYTWVTNAHQNPTLAQLEIYGQTMEEYRQWFDQFVMGPAKGNAEEGLIGLYRKKQLELIKL